MTGTPQGIIDGSNTVLGLERTLLIDWVSIGYDSREHYILEMADEHDVSAEGAFAVAELLGDEELFDGFVTALTDLSALLQF